MTTQPPVRYGPTLLVGLLASTLMTVAVSKPWVEASATTPGLPVLEATATGAEVAPVAGALSVVSLAAFGAVIATRGMLRRGLGGVVVAAAIVVVVAAMQPGSADGELRAELRALGWAGGDYATVSALWRWLAIAGAVAGLAAGAAVAAYGDRWPTMGARYDAPTATPRARPVDEPGPGQGGEADLWHEIDRGRDPTQPP